jgi:hypothetical protein
MVLAMEEKGLPEQHRTVSSRNELGKHHESGDDIVLGLRKV